MALQCKQVLIKAFDWLLLKHVVNAVATIEHTHVNWGRLFFHWCGWFLRFPI